METQHVYVLLTSKGDIQAGSTEAENLIATAGYTLKQASGLRRQLYTKGTAALRDAKGEVTHFIQRLVNL